MIKLDYDVETRFKLLNHESYIEVMQDNEFNKLFILGLVLKQPVLDVVNCLLNSLHLIARLNFILFLA